MKSLIFTPALIALLLTGLAGCSSDKAGQDLYQSSEIGQAKRILPCTVVSAREVRIRDKQAGGTGESLGFIVGALSTAQNNDNPAVRVLGGLAGGAVGRAASDKLRERKGVEYTVLLASGEERQLVQDIAENEVLLQPGEACRLQVSGNLNRVLPARQYPKAVQRPEKVRIEE